MIRKEHEAYLKRYDSRQKKLNEERSLKKGHTHSLWDNCTKKCPKFAGLMAKIRAKEEKLGKENVHYCRRCLSMDVSLDVYTFTSYQHGIEGETCATLWADCGNCEYHRILNAGHEIVLSRVLAPYVRGKF